MQIKVLGSAAGGGVPQWNCNCRNCRDARALNGSIKSRTQSSLAVSAKDRHFVLLNASPDLRQQINSTPALHPDPMGVRRSSPIKAVVLTNADVDHVAGLLSMREGQPFTIYATQRVLEVLASNSILDVLDRSLVRRIPLSLGRPVSLQGPSGFIGLDVEAFPVPGKVALYLEDQAAGDDLQTHPEDTIGLKVAERGTDRYFYYVPGCAELDNDLRGRLRGAPLVFLDGTLYVDDEMIEQGLLARTGTRMGHMSISGESGTLAAFKSLGVRRKVFVHINNSNPVLQEGSEDRRMAEEAGWEMAHDGLTLKL